MFASREKFIFSFWVSAVTVNESATGCLQVIAWPDYELQPDC